MPTLRRRWPACHVGLPIIGRGRASHGAGYVVQRTFPEADPDVCLTFISCKRLSLLEHDIASVVTHLEARESRAGWDTVPRGIPCRVGYCAAWDTVPGGIPCRVGYSAGWNTMSGS